MRCVDGERTLANSILPLKKNVSTTLLLTNTDFPHELFENSLKNRQLNILHWSSHFGHVASWWGPV